MVDFHRYQSPQDNFVPKICIIDFFHQLTYPNFYTIILDTFLNLGFVNIFSYPNIKEVNLWTWN